MINELFNTFSMSHITNRQSTIRKDLKLNFKKIFDRGALSLEDAYLALYAAAITVKNQPLTDVIKESLSQLGLDEDLIAEAEDMVALSSMLNIYYRFRHFIENDQGQVGREKYKRTGLRMNGMLNPKLGHRRVEMLLLVVSVINGCERCVNGHEKKLLEMDTTTDQIHDLIRLAALAKGLTILSN